jgi:hypothetical protein
MNSKMFVLVAALAIVAVSAFAIAAFNVSAQMYNYGAYYYPNANLGPVGTADYNAFISGMQQEMKDAYDLQQQYQAGQITLAQYQQELQRHWDEMAALHQQYGVGYPMMGPGAYGWMMGGQAYSPGYAPGNAPGYGPGYGGMMGGAYRGGMGMMW